MSQMRYTKYPTPNLCQHCSCESVESLQKTCTDNPYFSTSCANNIINTRTTRGHFDPILKYSQ